MKNSKKDRTVTFENISTLVEEICTYLCRKICDTTIGRQNVHVDVQVHVRVPVHVHGHGQEHGHGHIRGHGNDGYYIFCTSKIISIRHYLPFVIMCHSAFITFVIFFFRHYLPINVLSHSVLITFNLLSFCHYLPFDILSFWCFYYSTFFPSAFCPIRRFVRRRFLQSTFFTSTFCHLGIQKLMLLKPLKYDIVVFLNSVIFIK